MSTWGKTRKATTQMTKMKKKTPVKDSSWVVSEKCTLPPVRRKWGIRISCQWLFQSKIKLNSFFGSKILWPFLFQPTTLLLTSLSSWVMVSTKHQNSKALCHYPYLFFVKQQSYPWKQSRAYLLSALDLAEPTDLNHSPPTYNLCDLGL